MKTHSICHLAFAAFAVVAAIPAAAQTFTTVTLDSTNNTGQHTSYAIVNGNPAIAYYDATAQDLRYVRATNAAGTTWGAPVTVDSTADSGQFCSLALVNGRPAISYHDVTNGDLHYVRAGDADGATWGAPMTVHSTGDTGHYTCLLVVGGNPAIAYYDLSLGQLEYIRATDADGGGWPGTQVVVDTTSGNDVGSYASMAIMNGNPAISYFNAQGKDLMYVRASDATGSTWGAAVTVDAGNATGTGQYTSLAVVNGNPAISYHDAQNGDLHYIRATDANGTTWPFNTPVLVDGSSTDSGHFTSLAVIGGVPAISYYDLTNGDLHYVTGNDASGTAWGTPVNVDTAGDVGQYTSLGLLNGVAAISYYDVTGGNLKFAFVPTPDIAVEQPAGTELISSFSAVDFGDLNVGAEKSLVFTVKNSGSANLNISNTYVGGDPAGEYLITSAPVSPLTPGSSTTCIVKYSPKAVGTTYPDLHFVSDDRDELSFNVWLIGTGVAPEIAVEQPLGTNVADGGSKDFGSVAVGANTGLMFTILNTGNANLTGLGVTIDGADSSMFSVTATPTAPVNGSAGSTTFTVQFAPASLGLKTAALHIASNDADENPFDITITGLGLPSTNANLSNLTLSVGTLVPVFASGTTSYTASVAFGDSSLTVTPTAAHPVATITVNGNPVASGAPSGSFALSVGANVINTVVTAQDGVTAKTYTITVTRDAAVAGDLDSLNAPITGSYLTAAAVQPDGKTILVGTFSSVLGVARNNIARLNVDGTLDTAFNPNANSTVFSVSVQSDGKIVIGGSFGSLQPNGAATPSSRSRIARLEADGSLDTTFTPSASDRVFCVIPQPDGKILVGGEFLTIQGTGEPSATARQRIARLNADGSLDTGFDPKANGSVNTVALEPSGKVVLGGNFRTLQSNGAPSATSRNRVARVNANGTLDSGFDPNADSAVYCVAVQPDGKILLGGQFAHLQPNGAGSPTVRMRAARVNSDGTLDAAFDPSVIFNAVLSLTVQANGKVLIGGDFTTVNGVTRSNVACVDASGALDTGFNPAPNNQVWNVSQQADGKILLGGFFSALRPNGASSSTARSLFARLINDAASETLNPTSNARVQWLRGGGVPETMAVTFELSTDGGTSYSPLGVGTRIVGGWELTSLSMPANGQLRARARTSGGFQNAASGLVESVASFSLANPEIVVEQPVGNERPDGSGTAIYFGTIAVGGNASRVFTVKNTGVGDLAGLGITIDGADPSMFSVTVSPVAPVSGSAGSTTFTIQYAPTAGLTHTANLHLSSNDSDESPYDLLLVGSTIAPDIAVYDPGWGGTEITNGQPGAVSFGTTPVGTPVSHNFAVYNLGGGVIQCGAITVPTGFSVLSAPSQMPPGGGVGLVIQLTAAAPGVYSGSVSIGSNDPDENPFTFPITGTVTGGSMPAPVGSALGDIVTAGSAPDASGTVSIGTFDPLRRGGFLAENGNIVFPGNLLIGSGTPPVTLSPNTFMGLWKDAGTGAKLLARGGDAAPEAGGALFDVLPTVPAINDSGEVTFLASLVVGSGAPATTVDNDTGLWSELGGTGTGILIREGDTIPGLAPLQVGAFASGCYATAHTGASTGEAAFCITMKNGSTDTAILRASITGPTVTAVGVVARENTSAPGTAELFGLLASSYSDALRMDATGNLAFAALTKTSKEGIWYQPISTGVTTKAVFAGETAPGTGGATFKSFRSPAIGSGGTITFRGFLNNNGDNAAGLRNDGIWRGTASGGFTCILLRGDDNVTRPGLGLPAGAKVGNVWGGWLTNANHGAWRAWLDVGGDGTSSFTAGDVYALYADTSGTMKMVTRVGDAAPGAAGTTFASFDLPVVGGVEQMAFLGKLAGVGVTGANDQGIWREAANGGALSLVLRTGTTMTTTQGTKTISKLDFPGSNTTDRRWEQPVMDSTGRLIVLVTFTDGSTSQVLAP